MDFSLLNPFDDILPATTPGINPSSPTGVQNISNLNSLSVGVGATAIKSDRSGFWIGGNTFASAPFSVDMNGNVIANTAKISSYRRSFLRDFYFLQASFNPAVVSWASGKLYFADGTIYTISSGSLTLSNNTTYYFYFDSTVSTTVIQHTTTVTNAITLTSIPLLYVVINNMGGFEVFDPVFS